MISLQYTHSHLKETIYPLVLPLGILTRSERGRRGDCTTVFWCKYMPGFEAAPSSLSLKDKLLNQMHQSFVGNHVSVTKMYVQNCVLSLSLVLFLEWGQFEAWKKQLGSATSLMN